MNKRIFMFRSFVLGLFVIVSALLFMVFSVYAQEQKPQWRHGLAMHGDPQLPEGFEHLAYVNPHAPKGGIMRMGILGSFDSLNPFIVKGQAVQAVRNLVVESLMARSFDEPFSIYGLIAEKVLTPEDRAYVEFALNPKARFADGKPVTPEDVLFSFELLKDKGRPNHRSYYLKVTEAKKTGENTVRFDFAIKNDREMPLIMGLMPIFPKHATNMETFDETTLQPLIGSGPYMIDEVDRGNRVTLKRNPDYWGWEVASNRGKFNFDTLRYEYYRDGGAMFEAFKKGLIDIRAEDDPARWARDYDFPAVRDGNIALDRSSTGVPKALAALVFNTRRPHFADSKVREALLELFDFNWVNKNLYHGLFNRSVGYFDGSELSAVNRPASEQERKLLSGYPGSVRPDIMEGTYIPPAGAAKTDGGYDRAAFKRASVLLTEAGYGVKNGRMVHLKSGSALQFEMLVASRDQEKLAQTYARSLKRMGIDVSIRQVDSAQYERRRQTYDFDMMQNIWFVSLSPGNEQSFYWGSAAADTDGTRNYMGIKNPAVDGMIEAMLAAQTREDFVSAVRALDRTLMSGFYVIPLFHLPEQWVARWTHIATPTRISLYGYMIETWWQHPEEARP